MVLFIYSLLVMGLQNILYLHVVAFNGNDAGLLNKRLALKTECGPLFYKRQNE